jgi:hypothetical protein
MIPRTSSRAALAAFLLLASCRDATPAQAPEAAKPQLFLITALPIAFSEQFGLDQAGSPVMKALEQDYRVRLVDLPSQLPERALLLAAQPRALPAEELVKLDGWVRRGGRMLLLADPMLEWPSGLPLGDKRRAPIAFADTGLLQHWGLRLDAPEQRGPVQSTLGGKPVLTGSPGTLVGSGCRIADDGLLAECSIGKGKAIVVADADLLNAGSDAQGDGNLPALESQLASLTR